MAVKERDLMGGLAKGLKVIEAFSAERPRLSIAETADIVGLDRATTRRCLLTLWELGYAAYDGKFFTVTPRVLRLGIGCLASLPIPRIVQPYLDALSEKIGQSSSVSILDETEIVYIARAAQRRVMSISLMPGSRLPAYCTSMGRVLLAVLSEDEARSILEKSALVTRTEHTETDIDRLLADIKETRVRGYASIDQEVELGLVSVAVPLKTAGGRVVAAANIGMAASGRSMKEVIDHYLPPLLELQAELRQTLV
ncbi:IclR family transcriptional regulator domain-containing protein [Sinorhizobium meliloti]|uniref:IclR family transcriptional regulator domain-containing protein n=1 Tax=Rhizobium meliloti TaxID=382 RepID=UPI0002F8EA1C|nr:IclR family transcriptional regulator C-terminal domain-containing protein [Sinorhizobium meliloti]ASP83134.1 IclR family transcriptional regulator [Sinorhizobium meliloti]MQV24934.1 helix-turn-helix domain-containing protein [Sinorhizobium meliloti]MQV37396.1 helix-turn-helix domain-containing protein [Sinorhizobium meliloti]MQW20110.1 helix-turn-helix domain-containing protein [Sinorhizobium meliloti]RVE78993.1 IclR family transcriptional regulator [Sinorhizobium meliloti]